VHGAAAAAVGELDRVVAEGDGAGEVEVGHGLGRGEG
jgi:hypothetical protein